MKLFQLVNTFHCYQNQNWTLESIMTSFNENILEVKYLFFLCYFQYSYDTWKIGVLIIESYFFKQRRKCGKIKIHLFINMLNLYVYFALKSKLFFILVWTIRLLWSENVSLLWLHIWLWSKGGLNNGQVNILCSTKYQDPLCGDCLVLLLTGELTK